MWIIVIECSEDTCTQSRSDTKNGQRESERERETDVSGGGTIRHAARAKGRRERHAPTTAPHVSSRRSRMRSSELDTIRKRSSECVGCLCGTCIQCLVLRAIRVCAGSCLPSDAHRCTARKVAGKENSLARVLEVLEEQVLVREVRRERPHVRLVHRALRRNPEDGLDERERHPLPEAHAVLGHSEVVRRDLHRTQAVNHDQHAGGEYDARRVGWPRSGRASRRRAGASRGDRAGRAGWRPARGP